MTNQVVLIKIVNTVNKIKDNICKLIVMYEKKGKYSYLQ